MSAVAIEEVKSVDEDITTVVKPVLGNVKSKYLPLIKDVIPLIGKVDDITLQAFVTINKNLFTTLVLAQASVEIGLTTSFLEYVFPDLNLIKSGTVHYDFKKNTQGYTEYDLALAIYCNFQLYVQELKKLSNASQKLITGFSTAFEDFNRSMQASLNNSDAAAALNDTVVPGALIEGVDYVQVDIPYKKYDKFYIREYIVKRDDKTFVNIETNQLKRQGHIAESRGDGCEGKRISQLTRIEVEALLHDPSDAYITELSDLKTDRENAMKAIADSTPEHTERYYEFFTSPDFVCNRDLPTDEENYELE